MKTFILIIVWASGTYSASGTTHTLTQEFSSFKSCERARIYLTSYAHSNDRAVIAQGCFEK